MEKKHIQVYGRLKPVDAAQKLSVEDYTLKSEDGIQDQLTLIHKTNPELINNRPEKHTFKFAKIFDQDVDQKTVFNVVAKPVAKSFLQGYNGTIFAYGQTGSGKTYTISCCTAKEQGLIQQMAKYIFKKISESKEFWHKVFITYLEVYNENGYDLLSNEHDVQGLEDLQRVTLLSDNKGTFHLWNLKRHEVKTETELLVLFSKGYTNRMVAATPMNPNSSRSHCIFAIHLQIGEKSSSKFKTSQLNLVDLAGSERVYKSSLDGKLLIQAKHINLSLHYLEQVIIALSDPSWKHVPYRNSMMTSVLKNSLSGNCVTVMIATLSLNSNAIEETISTCRFAQRVALINTEPVVNEELDPYQEIKLLQKKVTYLENQLHLASDVKHNENLTSSEIFACKRLVQEFLEGDNAEELPEIPRDFRKIQQCFMFFQEAHRDAKQDSKVVPNLEHKPHQDTGQQNQEVPVLLNNIEVLKSVLEGVTAEQTSSCRSTPRSDTSNSFHTNIAETNTINPNEVYFCANDRRHSSAASKLYEQYSPQEQQAINAFTLQDVSIADAVKALKSKLKLKTQDLKDIVSLKERSHEKSLSLSQMLKTHKSDSGGDPSSYYETHLKHRLLQEEEVRKDATSKLQAVKSEIYGLREQIEGERMQLIAKFESWRMSTTIDSTMSSKHANDWCSLSDDVEDDCPQSQSKVDGISSNYGKAKFDNVLLNRISDEKATILRDSHSKDANKHESKFTNSSKYSYVTTDCDMIKLPTSPSTLEYGTNREGMSNSKSQHQSNFINPANTFGELKKSNQNINDITLQISNSHLVSSVTNDINIDSSAPLRHSANDCEYFNRKHPEQDIINSKPVVHHLTNEHGPGTNAASQLSDSEDEGETGLTGDPDIDEVVREFYRARGKLYLDSEPTTSLQ